MSTPVHQLTMAEVHEEFNSLVDNILAKFEQLDSGEFGAVGNLAFNTKSAKFAALFAHMSQLCHSSSIEEHLFRSKHSWQVVLRLWRRAALFA